MPNNQAEKKVLIFSTAYLPLLGGAEVAVKEITDRLPDWQFDLITAKIQPGLSNFEKIGNVNVERLGWGIKLDKFLLPFLGFWKARQLQKENNYNLAWSIMASQASLAACFFKNRFKNIKLVLTLQEGDTEEHLKRYVFNSDFLYKLLIRPWHLLVFRKADFLTAISHDLKNRAVRNGVVAPIEIIPNGVDFEYFAQDFSLEQLQPLKNKFKKTEKEKLIITTGRLVKKNATGDVIKALQYLPEEVKFLILAIGPDLKKLQKLARDIGVDKRVIFGGFIGHQDLPKYLKIADIFVRPSLSEGLGNSFLEAMAVGLPIIGTPVGGIPDFLKDPSTRLGQATGLFCQVGNPKDLAEKIKKILSDSDLREQLIRNGQKLVKEEYNWDKIALQMEEVFKGLSS